MNEQAPVAGSAMMQAERDALEAASRNALARRRASREISTYELDGWIVQEHPGGRIERLAQAGEFHAADFPYLGFMPPQP